jgi:hypothetical protein
MLGSGRFLLHGVFVSMALEASIDWYYIAVCFLSVECLFPWPWLYPSIGKGRKTTWILGIRLVLSS